MNKDKPTYDDLKQELEVLRKKVKSYENEEKFSSYFENNKAVMLQINTETKRIINANNASVDFYGFTREELLEKTIYDLQTLSVEEVNSRMRNAIKNKSNLFEFSHKTANGEIKDVQVYSSTFKIVNDLYMIVTIYDVTEQKLIEQKLKNENERFTTVMNFMDSIVYVADFDTHEILFTNKYVTDLFGDIKGEKCYSALQNKKSECSFCTNDIILDNLRDSSEPYIWEFQNLVTKRWYHCSDSKIQWIDGRFVRMEIATDITNRKIVEQALEENEANLNSLINNQKESIWSIDKNYNYIIFNDFFKEAYKDSYNVELQIGTNSLSILSKELKEFWKAKYDMAFAGKKVVFEFSSHMGNEIYFHEVSLNPIIFDNKISGVSALSIDITEKKEARKILLESKANISAIIENTTDSIWAINHNYEILYVNAVFEIAFYASFGVHLKPGVNLLMALPEILRPDWKKRYDRALNNERFSFVDKIKLEKSSIYIEVFMHPIIVDEIVVGASFFSSDITERKHSEEAIKESEAQLIELNSTKDKLFSIIAHDLRSPFTSILGLSRLLLNNIKTYDIERSVNFVSQINASTKSTLALLDNLLDWAKSQSGQLNFEPETVSLSLIINEIVEISNSTAKIKNISINKNQSKEIKVNADENMLKTILRNLISNAIKYTNSGGEVNIFTKINQLEIEIRISDNGIGMSKEDQNKLFSLDTNFTTIGTAKEKGSGLGLILCKEFVEKHGGKIWIESEIEKGCDIIFTIPIND